MTDREEHKLLATFDEITQSREAKFKDAAARAARDVIAAKFGKVREPAPTIDMTPVADAIAGMRTEFRDALASLGKTLMAVMLKAMAAQKPIEFKPIINLPETVVNVAAPIVNVETPKQPERKPRKLKIKHDETTNTSTVTEE